MHVIINGNNDKMGYGIINIYHCCVQKTGSQWVKAILSDSVIKEKTGMDIFTYQRHLPGKVDARKLTERFFTTGMPEKTIVSPLYLDYQSYQSIPKPKSYRTLFISRDPRDVVVSWYFSVKYTHPSIGRISEVRNKLKDLSDEQGLTFSIDYLQEFGIFDSLSSWKSRKDHKEIFYVKFEEMIGREQIEVFNDLFDFLSIDISRTELNDVISHYSFNRLKEKSMIRNGYSHYRKGIVGDWKNQFSDAVSNYFEEKCPKLIEYLGYGW